MIHSYKTGHRGIASRNCTFLNEDDGAQWENVNPDIDCGDLEDPGLNALSKVSFKEVLIFHLFPSRFSIL